MYSNQDAAVPVGVRRGLFGLPILAICCLLCLLFVIAATIVLALIPIYLAAKSVTPSAATTYYATSDFSGATVSDGTLNSAAQSSLGTSLTSGVGAQSGAFTVNNAYFLTTTAAQGKRKRRALHQRSRRFYTGLGFQYLYIVFTTVPSIFGYKTLTITSLIIKNVSFVYNGVPLVLVLTFIKISKFAPTELIAVTNATSTTTTTTTTTAAVTTGMTG